MPVVTEEQPTAARRRGRYPKEFRPDAADQFSDEPGAAPSGVGRTLAVAQVEHHTTSQSSMQSAPAAMACTRVSTVRPSSA